MPSKDWLKQQSGAMSTEFASVQGKSSENFVLDQYETLVGWLVANKKAFKGSDNYVQYGYHDDGKFFLSKHGYKVFCDDYNLSNSHLLTVFTTNNIFKETPYQDFHGTKQRFYEILLPKELEAKL